MLSGEYFRRRHIRRLQCPAPASGRLGVHDRVGSRRRNERFSAPDIAFEEPRHRMRLFEIAENIGYGALLRPGRPKSDGVEKAARKLISVFYGKRSLCVVFRPLADPRDLYREDLLEREA